LRQSCDTTCDKLMTRLATCALGRVVGKSILMPLPVSRETGSLFDNSLNNEGLGVDDRKENGYEKSCTRGAKANTFERSPVRLTSGRAIFKHSLEAFSKCCRRMRPIPSSSLSSTATPTNTLPAAPRPHLPGFFLPPTYVSSTSTIPLSRSLSGLTIARRSLCSHCQAV